MMMTVKIAIVVIFGSLHLLYALELVGPTVYSLDSVSRKWYSGYLGLTFVCGFDGDGHVVKKRFLCCIIMHRINQG